MMPGPPLRAIVVDDTALYRRAIRDSLSALAGVEVVGTASNGRLALPLIAEQRPDLVTLDLDMPELDGLGLLAALQKQSNPPAVLILSSHTETGGALTIKALEAGAFDFIRKPVRLSAADSMGQLRVDLAERIAALRSRLQRQPAMDLSAAPAQNQPQPQAGSLGRPLGQQRPRLAVIGVSTGGPQALMQILPNLDRDFPLPIVVVQHMPPLFTQALADSLSRRSHLPVSEGKHEEVTTPGRIYLAPGGKHLKVRAQPGGQVQLLITDDPPENHCKPSVDTLFRSAALQFPGSVLALVLTGMGNDGASGVQMLKRTGCPILAQDEATSTVFGMPKAAIATGCVDEVLPLAQVAASLNRLARAEGFR